MSAVFAFVSVRLLPPTLEVTTSAVAAAAAAEVGEIEQNTAL
jgi:hypothetical protein